MRSITFALAATLLAVAALPAPAVGPTFVVTSALEQHDQTPGDGICKTSANVCTLRAAVDEANLTTDARIVLPAITIALTDGDLFLARTVTLSGAGMRKTTITASPGSRIFTIDVAQISVTIEKMTLKDGALATGAGGAISVIGPASLAMSQVLVDNCSAPYGGALYSTGRVTISHSDFKGCKATKAAPTGVGNGGAIYIGPSIDGDDLALVDGCTFRQNVAFGEGGAIYLSGNYGSLTLANSTVSGNQAVSYGGGVRVQQGTLNADHVTITGNTSDAFAGGGGVSNASTASAAVFSNSLLAANYDANGQLLVDGDCSGAITSSICNIVGTAGTAHCTISGPFTAADPAFGPLQDNGGTTPTHALLSGSAGVDFASCLQNNPLLVDQRGVHRVGAHADLGAYERAPCGDANGDGVVDVLDVFLLINHLFAGGEVPAGLANVNQDSQRDVSDVFFLINRLFANGPAPVCPGT